LPESSFSPGEDAGSFVLNEFRQISPERKNEADSARLAGAEFVFSVLEEKSYSNLLLGSVFEGKNLSPLDRSFATAIGYGTITYLVNIDAIASQVSINPFEKIDNYVKAIIRSAIWQIFWSEKIPEYAVCNESVKITALFGNPGSVKYVNGILREILRKKEHLREKYILNPKPFHLKCSLPPQLAGYFKKWFGIQRAICVARAMTENKGLSLRLNTQRQSLSVLKESLEKDGFYVRDSLYMQNALQIKSGGIPTDRILSFLRGEFTVQDESAMLVSVIADPRPGNIVADVCSAPGGKSCHLAELMENNGKIYASDINESRLQLVRENANRLGANIIDTMQTDFSNLDMQWEKELCDIVLADVPCSGLGILHKKPDIRIHMNHEKIIGLYPIQKNIVQNAAKLLKPGGVLIYSTCTLNPMENQEQVGYFLDNEGKDFIPEDFSELLPKTLKEIDPGLAHDAAKGMITIYPDLHGSDGFFIAKLRRRMITE
jgi:16S rRNA (cytosine967-C5)-methyltransferase